MSRLSMAFDDMVSPAITVISTVEADIGRAKEEFAEMPAPDQEGVKALRNTLNKLLEESK